MKNYADPSLLLLLYLTYLFSSQASMATGDPSLHIFPESNSEYFNKVMEVKNILVDQENKKVYISAVNVLFSLSLDLETVYEVIKKPLTMCDQSTKSCLNNYIKTLQYDSKENIYACETNDNSPQCSRYKRNTLKDTNQMVHEYRVSQDPDVKDVTLFCDPYVFTATHQDKDDYKGIQKMRENAEVLIAKTKKDMMKEPEFVSAYKLDSTDYIYYFFREVSEEMDNRKTTYSRVARICKNDNGGTVLAEGIFMTFLKGHLLCKKTGDKGQVYYYDELQGTYMVDVHSKDSSKSESFIYGVFSLSLEGAASSAICRYRVKDIINVLETSPLNKQNKSGKWESVPFSEERTELSRPKCTNGLGPPKSAFSDNVNVIGATINILLKDTILPYDQEALYTRPTHLTTILVDDFHLNNDKSDIGIHMVFTGASDGKIYKIMINSTGRGTGRVVEALQPFQNSMPIYTMKKYQDTIYAGSSSGVAAFAVQRCESYLLCNDCVALKDPYCAWSLTQKKKCVKAKSLTQGDRIQDILNGNDAQCPEVEHTFDCQATIEKSVPGNYAILNCKTTSQIPGKTPTITAWSRGNKAIYNDEVYKVMNKLETLFIGKFDSTSAGMYECIIQLDGSKKTCSVTLNAPTTETVTTPQPLSSSVTINITDPATTTKTTTKKGAYTGDQPNAYFNAFIAMTVLFVITLLLVLILLCVLFSYRYRANEETEIDGEKSNGHPNGHRLHFPFKKNYKMNRKDSANKELLKQKNKNRVYKPTTIEMSDQSNGISGAEPV